MKSEGERLFAAYLRQRRLGWQYEPDLGGRRPDFLVEHPVRSFVAEVYEPQMRLPPSGGSFESYSALRGAFEGRKSKQISAVKRAGLPYVAVVASTNSDIRVQPLVVAGAMFGNLAVTLRVGPEVSERPDGRTVFGGGGRIQPRQFRGVSAVAILERFNPTQDRLEAATKARLACLPGWNATMTPRQIAEIKAAIVKLSSETAAQLIVGGAYDPLARRARLIVLHNPYASFPLGTAILNGSHDVQWGAVVIGGQVGYGELDPSAVVA
jgi:hypothetical protein